MTDTSKLILSRGGFITLFLSSVSIKLVFNFRIEKLSPINTSKLTYKEQFNKLIELYGFISYDEAYQKKDPYDGRIIKNYGDFIDFNTQSVQYSDSSVGNTIDYNLVNKLNDEIVKILGYQDINNYLEVHGIDIKNIVPEDIISMIAEELHASSYDDAIGKYDADFKFYIGNLTDYQRYLINCAKHYINLPIN